ncbi:hypothetical protein CKM354_001197100 [Cercospora kikuchii]|uniref:AB hydrolase-1 domain-containing protein n=1 Tax=Cercospora kikuchii TaxID=84275 RepID=A0A9P3D0Y9_9PEZI|nr:uncharacterized protein CKM354_001197100 [Cercospora kikuchii]GIZ48928.1 hypothetical protein CKM354_001197100 [Cercospora kikuchii]
MEKIKALLRKCNCFASRPTEAWEETAIPIDPRSKIRSPSPSPSRDSVKHNTNKTSIVVAHGAFHTSWHYQTFAEAVRKHTKIDRVLIPQQSSSGPSPPENCFDADVKLLHNTIATELLEGRDVLLVCHSYGAIPGCEALADLPLAQSGKTGKLLGIVFVSAFVTEAGQSLVTSKMGGRASWVKIDGPLSHVLNPIPTLYNTCPPTLTPSLVSHIVPQASSSFMTPTKHDLWKSFPCTYIRCLKDQAMVPTEQDFYIDRLKRFRPDTKVREIGADHVPFASVPDELAKVMEEVVEGLRVEK